MANATLENKAPETNKPDTSKALAHAQAHLAATVEKAPARSKEVLMTLILEGSVDPSVFAELQALNKGEASKKEEKNKSVTKLVAEMNAHGITMLDLKEGGAQVPDLDKMFDLETIKLVAAPYFTKPSATAAKPPKPKKLNAEGEEVATTREGNIQFDGVLYSWTRNLDDKAKIPLFEAFKAGKPIKSFLVKPDDKAAAARLVARMERETSTDDKKVTYSDANLSELGLTRASIVASEINRKKIEKAKADKAAAK